MHQAKTQGTNVVLLIDINCFYCQVEELKDCSLVGKPVCVFQKNFIATSNYIARRFGVHKGCTIGHAKRLCSDIVLRNGEDLTSYRDASSAFLSVLHDALSGTHTVLQKVGLDEVYVDVSYLVNLCLRSFASLRDEEPSMTLEEQSIVHRFFDQDALNDIKDNMIVSPGWCVVREATCPKFHITRNLCHTLNARDALMSSPQKKRTSSTLLETRYDDPLRRHTNAHISIASHICAQLRRILYERLRLSTSAGIASSKVTAKLACTYKKEPNVQLSVYPSATQLFLQDYPLTCVPRIGQTTFKTLCSKGVESIKHVLEYSINDFIDHFKQNRALAEYIALAVRGWDTLVDPVVSSGTPHSISVEDSFSSQCGLTSFSQLVDVVHQLTPRLIKRQEEHLAMYKEIPTKLKVALKFEKEFNRRSRQVTLSPRSSWLFADEKCSNAALTFLKQEVINMMRDWITASSIQKKSIYVVNLCLCRFQCAERNGNLFNYLRRHAVIPHPYTRLTVRRLTRHKRETRHQHYTTFHFYVTNEKKPFD